MYHEINVPQGSSNPDPHSTLEIQVDHVLMAFWYNVKTIKYYRIKHMVSRNKYEVFPTHGKNILH